MSEEQGAESVIETTTTADEAVFSSQEPENQASERDFEAAARDMGWVPESEWKGDKKPPKFLSAEEFVERGQTIIPILRKQLKDKDKDFDERLERMERVHAATIKKLQKQHAEKLASVQQEQRKAVEAGDVAEYDRLQKVRDDLIKDAPEAAETPTVPANTAAVQDAWIKANPWYEADEDLRSFAFGYSNDLGQRNPNMSLEDNLRRTAERVRKLFPDRFEETETPAANGHAAVDGGGVLNGAPRKGTQSRLPPEALAQAQKDVAAGIYKSVAAWEKVYFGN